MHADSHSEGVGSAFLSDMLAKLGSEGIKRVDLTVDVDNPKAISFYEGMGFRQEGVLCAYIKRAFIVNGLVYPVRRQQLALRGGKTLRALPITSALLYLLFVAEPAFAQGEAPEEEKRFTNETDLSLVNTTGNTDTLSLSGKNEMAYKFTEKWTGSWVVGALYAERDGDKEAERYFTDLRADYAIDERWYAYGLSSWLKDEFAGFDQRLKDGAAWKLNSETALVTALTDILALKVSYEVRHNNDPRPSDLDNTDTVLATSLVIIY